jgi:polar amino acid transport system substrate-binding protein
MTRSSSPRPAIRGVVASRLLLLVSLLLAVVVSGCAALGTDPTPLPGPPASSQPSAPASSAPPTRCPAGVPPSYEPSGALPAPGDLPAGSTMARIKERGRLIAGVSADTYLLASRNPLNGRIEGFDIDMVKAIAQAIFGDDSKYELRVITAAQRIPSLTDNSVDVVVRAMTINCTRWQQIAFSSEYYRAGQKILVRKGSKATKIGDLNGQRVCAPNGTSSMDNLKADAPKAVAVGADSHTGCLVLFQQGSVAAITGDDTVLAGLAAQDPYAVVPKQTAFTQEPYGIGINAKNVDLVRFVNARLAQMRSDGEWKSIYNRWLAAPLGPAPDPPKAVYGRDS